LKRLLRSCLALAVCISLYPNTAWSLPLISEVFYDAVGSDDTHSFVEIFAPAGTVLDGLFLKGVNGANGAVGPTVALSGVVGPGRLFVVADRDSGGSTSVPVFDLLANFDFQNGPDSIVLTDGTNVIDAIGYGSFGVGEVFAGEGAAALDAPPGSSLARFLADLDTDDNAADFGILGAPTPRSAVFSTVPEPGTAALLSLGLGGLAVGGRRRRR
jgi:hypothetical protein